MKFKVDQNLPLEFEDILAAHGHDVISVFRQGMNGASDEKVVDVCHAEGRALGTDVQGPEPGDRQTAPTPWARMRDCRFALNLPVQNEKAEIPQGK